MPQFWNAPQFVVIDDIAQQAVPQGNVPLEEAQAVMDMQHAALQQEMQMATAGTSIYNSLYRDLEFRSTPVKPTPKIVQNKNERIRELEKYLIEYDGYITQRQLVEALNRVFASKKIRRWRPERNMNKTDFLNGFVNLLWETIPDQTPQKAEEDHDDSEA